MRAVHLRCIILLYSYSKNRSLFSFSDPLFDAIREWQHKRRRLAEQSSGQFPCRAERARRWTRLVYHHPADKSVYARNALRFPIVLERFISSGERASPGGAVIFACTGCTLSQSADVQIMYSSARDSARPVRENAAVHYRGWNVAQEGVVLVCL